MDQKMKLESAVKALEAEFGIDDEIKIEDGLTIDIYSGRIELYKEAPALFASSDSAVESWARAVIDELNFHPLHRIKIRWLEKPKLHRYQMTEMDYAGLQRLVVERWAVTSKLLLKEGHDDGESKTES